MGSLEYGARQAVRCCLRVEAGEEAGRWPIFKTRTRSRPKMSEAVTSGKVACKRLRNNVISVYKTVTSCCLQEEAFVHVQFENTIWIDV